MINAAEFVDHLDRRDVRFFAGVPDSLLKAFCACVADVVPDERHLIAANEGGAVALAAGHHLATGDIGLVYMQNSGQGNAVNPLLSLADRAVYGIGMLLLIGWRGEPGVKDEPQHVKQGRVTLPLLETMEIPYRVLPDETQPWTAVLDETLTWIRNYRAPAALVVRKGTFAPWTLQRRPPAKVGLSREAAIVAIASRLDDRDLVVATTGKTSRELFEYRARLGAGHQRDFLTVGSMGHASQIALAMALARPGRRVICLDGDGAALMHLGGLAIIGSTAPANLRHVILNNGAHDSVGGQPTAATSIDLTGVASACGYRYSACAGDGAHLESMLGAFLHAPGPGLLEVKVDIGARADLGRPTSSPEANKKAFMSFASETS